MAITGVTTEPQDYRTVYNSIEYVATSDETATARFKYLFDVYDGATLLGRLKVPADPDGYGRSDIHGICESYLTTNLAAINTTATGAGFSANAQSWKTFTVKIGEEYDVAGVLTPDPDQQTKTVIVFNGCLPNYRGTDLNFVDYQATDYFENFTVNAVDRKYLTNAPKGSGINKTDNQSVELTDEGWIYALSDDPSDVTNGITEAKIITYDSTGATVTSRRVNMLAGLTDKHFKFPSSPNSLNNIDASHLVSGSQPIIPSSGVTSYCIYFDNSTTQVSEKIYFNVDSECRYEVRRLEFLNALGGFDCFNFTKVSRITEDVERKYFKQNADNMSSGVITYALSDKEKTQYYTKGTPKMKLTSDWVDVATFNWLVELIESPEIYLYDNGKRIAVQNIEGNWEQKVAAADTVFNLEVTLEFSMDNYRQRF